jgi:hypothetical protein
MQNQDRQAGAKFDQLIIPADALRTAAVLVSSYDQEYDDPRSVALAILRTILDPAFHREIEDRLRARLPLDLAHLAPAFLDD